MTADHGNADCMFTEKKGTREAMVAHTLNPVPFIMKDFSGANRLSLAGVPSPGLSHVAATLLHAPRLPEAGRLRPVARGDCGVDVGIRKPRVRNQKSEARFQEGTVPRVSVCINMRTDA